MEKIEQKRHTGSNNGKNIEEKGVGDAPPARLRLTPEAFVGSLPAACCPLLIWANHLHSETCMFVFIYVFVVYFCAYLVAYLCV